MYLNIFSIFILGLIFGSFCNVCIIRIPADKSVIRPGSHCPKCHNKIKWYHNIPILSYIILKGHCASCGKKISYLYPIVELITGLLFVLTYHFFKDNIIQLIFYLFINLIFIIIFFIDFKHYIIPDSLNLIGGIISLIYIFLLNPYNNYINTGKFVLSGFLTGGLLFFIIATIGEKIYNREVLGGGDIKFIAFTGIFLGWQKILITIFISAIYGLLYGIIIGIFKKKFLKLAIPYGPFLVLAVLTVIYYGKIFIDFYMNMLYF